MKKIITLILLVVILPISHSNAQPLKNKQSKDKEKIRIDSITGSFDYQFRNEETSLFELEKNLSTVLGLNEYFSFQKILDREDDLGYHHISFEALYKGVTIENNLVMLHGKGGNATYLNGQIHQSITLDTISGISKEEALKQAKNDLSVSTLIQEYSIEKVIYKSPKTSNFYLAYKVRIDCSKPLLMYHVYVDANSGEVIHKTSLISNADILGTAETLYSGLQAMTCDSYNGSYRLRDNGRKIRTYDATNSEWDDNDGWLNGAVNYTNGTLSWGSHAVLTALSIQSVSSSWWYAFTDTNPDLFIKIYDSDNQLVYVSQTVDNTNPPFTFTNMNIIFNNPPYTMELWDEDITNHDYGGSYTLYNTDGTFTWSGNGNNGAYAIDVSNNPGLDAHWGMQATYDFYLNTFNRDSYDDNGGLIRQYINPPSLQEAEGESPNNANASPAPYNTMQYGLGDGINFNPLVALDVMGHEFSHLVVGNNGNGGLLYESESGALNESFADIFGISIEFYANNNPDWTLGEDMSISIPFLRSMSNPNLRSDPDTYQGIYWADITDLEIDHGGVHTNSGVQNHWFYLLSEGGIGINDNGNSYNVQGIGIAKAQQIAYRNLINYLGPNATYTNAYNGSLQATVDLYGFPSTEYDAVQAAWYAVGIGDLPYCNGTQNLTSSTGTFSDGSDNYNYANNSNCTWLIEPIGAVQIQLDFTTFDTEENYDMVYVYNGSNENAPLLLSWTGNTLPNTVVSGATMYVKFESDQIATSSGWNAEYSAITVDVEDVIELQDFDIFPNPSNGEFFIYNKSNTPLNLRMFDVVGKEVYPLETILQGMQNINASSLAKGIYIIHIEKDGIFTTEKMLIQ